MCLLRQPTNHKKVRLYHLSYPQLSLPSLHSAERKITNLHLTHIHPNTSLPPTLPRRSKPFDVRAFYITLLSTPNISLYFSSLLFSHCSFLCGRNWWALSPIAHDLTRSSRTPQDFPSSTFSSHAFPCSLLFRYTFFLLSSPPSPQSWPSEKHPFKALHPFTGPPFSKNSLSSLSLLLYLLSFSTNRILLIPLLKTTSDFQNPVCLALFPTSFHLWICNIFILTSWNLCPGF